MSSWPSIRLEAEALELCLGSSDYMLRCVIITRSCGLSCNDTEQREQLQAGAMNGAELDAVCVEELRQCHTFGVSCRAFTSGSRCSIWGVIHCLPLIELTCTGGYATVCTPAAPLLQRTNSIHHRGGRSNGSNDTAAAPSHTHIER